MPYPIVNPLGSMHYTSKISVPSLYWCSDYELPRTSKSRRHPLLLDNFQARGTAAQTVRQSRSFKFLSGLDRDPDDWEESDQLFRPAEKFFDLNLLRSDVFILGFTTCKIALLSFKTEKCLLLLHCCTEKYYYFCFLFQLTVFCFGDEK